MFYHFNSNAQIHNHKVRKQNHCSLYKGHLSEQTSIKDLPVVLHRMLFLK